MPENTQKYDELRLYMERLEDRIRELEQKKEQIKIENKQTFIIPSFDILRVNKLYASLPVFTVARTGTPQNGEIYITNIGGIRKINIYISGVNYSIAIT